MPISDLHLVDPVLLRLCQEFRNRGLVADLPAMSVCGEPDIRLLVHRRGEDVSVELLGTLVCDPVPAHWQAVRVWADQRLVWQGPRRNCPQAELMRFVQTLLSERPEVATDQYTLLG